MSLGGTCAVGDGPSVLPLVTCALVWIERGREWRGRAWRDRLYPGLARLRRNFAASPPENVTYSCICRSCYLRGGPELSSD